MAGVVSSSFFDSKICKERKRCWQCRVNVTYRESIADAYDVPSVHFECPFGVTEDSIPEDQRGATVADMAKGVSGEIAASAVRLAKGKSPFTPKTQAEQRIAICEACTNYFNTKNRTCKICKCFMDAKVKMETSQCPAKKW